MARLVRYSVNIDAVKDRMFALQLDVTGLARRSGLQAQRLYRFFDGSHRTLETIQRIPRTLELPFESFVQRETVEGKVKGRKK